MRFLFMLAFVALTAACAQSREEAAQTDTAAAMSEDADVVASGATGVPQGFMGRTDRANQNLSDARYTPSGNRWEVVTGPAHIVYAAGDSARGEYTARATFEQMEAPAHPEAFGLFIGGSELDQPGQRYTYFLVRGTGEYLIKVREGDQTRNVVGWTMVDAVPKADSSGKATYRLAARVGRDSVRFLVNDTQVAAAATSAVPTNGIAGLRINHNLHLTTGRVQISR